MKKVIKQWTVTLILITIGVLKWDIMKLPKPKTLHILLNISFKMVISFFLAKNKIYFDPYILMISLLLSANKLLLFESYEHLEIILLAVLAPIKIIFILLFYKFFRNKFYTIIQYFSIFSIIIANFLIQLKEKDKKKDISYIIGISCSIFASFFAASAMIIFDQKIRKRKLGFWNYMYCYTFLGFFITIFELIAEKKMTNYDFFEFLKNWKFIFNVLMSVAETFLSTYLVFNLNPLEKGLNGNLIIVSSTFLANFFYEESLTVIDVISCIIAYVGIVIFEWENHKIKKSQKKSIPS
ncbi:putative transporter [Pseudoloma neurophilia]|uniref:Putative transporter n=1 Tax=Pseudoloma neurophilia TaxID=146866 RepID=A0A0R0LS83_9MICR|nr:putative transporter [Pseudoloma neurophilia]